MAYLDNFFNIKDKVIVITGACGQLGNGFSKSFLAAGAKVIGIDMKISMPLNEVKYYEVDITKKDQVDKLFEKVHEEYGRIDVLINNAGVSTFEPFEERPEEKIDWVMDVNLKATFFCIQAYVKYFDLHPATTGNIINIASFYGVISPDFRIYEDGDRKNSEIYGATKAGVIQMTKYFAVHLAERNIRVNAVSPGGIYNPVHPQGEKFIENFSFRCPMKRMGNAEELQGILLYLASDASTYTSGQNITIDGGMSSW